MKSFLYCIALWSVQTAFCQDLKDLKQLKKTEVGSFQPASEKNTLKKFRIGLIYESNGFYGNALEYYNQALDNYKGKIKDSLYVIVSNKIGGIYNTTRQYKDALGFINDAFKVSKALDYKVGLANALSLLGANYEKQGEYLKALESESRSLHYLSVKANKFEVAKVYENIGSIYEDLLQFEKASQFFHKSYAIVKATNTRQEANVLNNLGDIHRKKENLDSAIVVTNQALQLSLELKDNHLLESAHKDLAKSFALKGDYKKAYTYRIEAEKFKELALLNENKKQVNLLLTDFEIDKKESQIKILEAQNKSGKTQLLLALVLSASVIIILLILYLSIRKKRIANAKIQKYEQERLQSELDKKWAEEKNMQKNLELKTAALSNYSLHIAQKNKMLSDLSLKLKNMAGRKTMNHENLIKDLYVAIDFTLQQENEWEDFNIFFEEIHPNYIKNLSDAAIETLSPTELKLGILLRLNLSSKEIASILRVTPDSVRVARHRFRKKLPIDSKKDLVNFLLSL
ncbi:tetratricopeptide repeat protein [Flavobacterium humi]|uniref:Tetratricopeptide repeat protein n=1 Tax=Flavobacterium humi TaxID=2562683 RepID=A0A4Z0LD05_9FLAO|nr:tetratricopeptide repeat protein [Flavobacterium humi]TGD59770.1 tetratricopeptide repeat protein [Flavobacterium humi]